MNFSSHEIKQELQRLISKNNFSDNLAFDKKLDEFFFPNIQQNEVAVSTEREDAYPQLNEHALLTSYLDYYKILNDIPEGEKLVDLGAGYCRGTLLSQLLGLPVCESIEFIEQRVRVAKHSLERIQGDTQRIICADLSETSLPSAYAYYLYFPTGEVLDEVLIQLAAVAQEQDEVYLYACESHGDLLPYLDYCGHLEKVDHLQVSSRRHAAQIEKYRVRPLETELSYKLNIVSWYLRHKHEDLLIVFDYFHPLKKKKMQWIHRLLDLQLVMHGSEPVFVDSFGRRIMIHRDEPIVDIISNNSEVDGYLRDKNTRKLFWANGYQIENQSGEFLSV